MSIETAAGNGRAETKGRGVKTTFCRRDTVALMIGLAFPFPFPLFYLRRAAVKNCDLDRNGVLKAVAR